MPAKSQEQGLILASTSPYRRQLLERLGIPFRVVAPGTDEAPLPGEEPEALVARLAQQKALAVAQHNRQAIVIGADQVAVHRGRVLGKPGTADRAAEQLAAFSGERVTFLSAIALHRLEDGFCFEATIGTEVHFRDLTDDEIHRYVKRDNPVDCAGGFRSEATGSALLRTLTSSDPTAIIGLPLIAVAEGLRRAGLQVP